MNIPDCGSYTSYVNFLITDLVQSYQESIAFSFVLFLVVVEFFLNVT